MKRLRKKGDLMTETCSVVDLLAAPDRFDAKTVVVVGFYIGEREHHAIYPSRGDIGETSRGIWLSHEATVGGQEAATRLSRGWVRVAGVFHNRRRSGAGHFGAFPAYISAITKLEAAESL
jgi:hypothetical protein